MKPAMNPAIITTATAAAALLLAAFSAPAAAKDKRIEDHDLIYPGNSHSLHVRYPGDKAWPFGTAHVRGGRKIPYVERCSWTYRRGEGLKQTCRRYTPENAR